MISRKIFACYAGVWYTLRDRWLACPWRRKRGATRGTAWLSTLLLRSETQIMAKTVCKILGFVFLLVGLLGFTTILAPVGAHLTPAHNMVHIISGVVALYFGFAGTLTGARGFALVFGIVYLALGIFGMLLGTDPGKMWHLGPLVLGTADHGIHLILGAIFLAGGLFTKK